VFVGSNVSIFTISAGVAFLAAFFVMAIDPICPRKYPALGSY